MADQTGRKEIRSMNGIQDKNEGKTWSPINRVVGDRLIWIVTILLLMFSVLVVYSSTSLARGTSRLDLGKEQLFVASACLLGILFIYKVGTLGIFRWFGKYCFLLSFAALAFLLLRLDLGPIAKAGQANGAYRFITLFGFQLHIFEVVKVIMVMYIAWACEALKNGQAPLAEKLSQFKGLGWLKGEGGKSFLYVILPIGIVVVMILPNGNSSAIMIGVFLVVTALIGGIKFKHMLLPAMIGVAVLILAFTIMPGGGRIGTMKSRIESMLSDPMETMSDALKHGDKQTFRKVYDKNWQPLSAKLAIAEGGLIGKGIGNSTQKYKVAKIYEDYAFSFIIEEYGLIVGLFILSLYATLLARGAVLVRHCESFFAKILIAGLVLTISGQAMVHVLVNVHLFPQTGQTLPIISHGNSSLLFFSLALGMILCVSKYSKLQMDMKREEMEPIIVRNENVNNTLDELDQFESET